MSIVKDEIAFLCSELSRELRSNKKTIEVLLEQNSHYPTHQRRCNEFQRNNQNKCTQFDPPNSFTTEPSKSLLNPLIPPMSP